MKKRKEFHDYLDGKYLVAQNNIAWCIDATFINSGTLLLVVDLATRMILGDLYLHNHKSNEFEAGHVIILLKKCLIDRNLYQNQSNKIDLIIHSDQGKQFQSQEFELFCKEHGIKRSITKKPRGNQVIESLNAVIKDNIRLRVDPKITEFKRGTWADPLKQLKFKSKEEILNIIKFAIEAHINNISTYNQQMSPSEFDIALDQTKIKQPKILFARNDQSEEAKEVIRYRNEVTTTYAGDWALFFANWKKTQDKEFECAKQERALILKQNQELTRKVDLQIDILKKQDILIQQLVDELNQKQQKERDIEEKRAKRKAAKKRPPRDVITNQDFLFIIQSIPQLTLKTARLKVAFTLLYLTGLRVSNLLQFSVQNLQDLIQKQNTLLHIIKGGGIRKIIIATQAKSWFQLIDKEISFLVNNKQPDQPLFTNKNGDLITRVKFNQQLNQVLKAVSIQLNKKIFTHSFRITMVTELLQTQPIQKVKSIIGHKDIRTTELYDRNFLGERELRKAIQSVYKQRKVKNHKTDV